LKGEYRVPRETEDELGSSRVKPKAKSDFDVSAETLTS
jgi:hypothetical protein